MAYSPRPSPALTSSAPTPGEHRFIRALDRRLSLEKELAAEEAAFETYGGDAPDSQRLSPVASRASSERQSDEPTAVNSVDDSTAIKPKTEEAELDYDLVSWDGPNDPENPQNYSVWKKIALTALITILTVNVTFASSAPSTATFAIAEHFHVGTEVAILVTSFFLLGYVVGPILWSGMSETYGRRNVFIGTILTYTLFIMGQPLAKNIQTLLITRFLSGVFAAAPLTNGGGFIADVWDPVGRGKAVAVFTAAVFIGPIAGPIMGNFVIANTSLGWPWIFWIIMIFSGLCSILCILFLPETFAPVLLTRRARRLRKADPIKNAHKFSAFERETDTSFSGLLKRTVFRPFIMLAKEPILVLITVYMGMVYGLIYALFEVIPIVFEEVRGIKPTLTGLMFIGTGIGSTTGAAVTFYQGKSYSKLMPKWRGTPPPEERLHAAMIGGPLLAGAIFWLGWTGNYRVVPWYVVELSTIPLGLAISLVFISFQSYLVDTYLAFSASALAANSILRSAAGAAFPLFTVQMYHNLGVQWASTLLGCIALVLAPMPFVFYRWGATIRRRSKFAPCIDLKIRDELEREEREKNTSIV